MLFILVYFLDDAVILTVARAEAFAVCIPTRHSIRGCQAFSFASFASKLGQRECVSSKPRPLGVGGYRELAGSVARGEASVICIRGCSIALIGLNGGGSTIVGLSYHADESFD
jgi:hypothetical protein